MMGLEHTTFCMANGLWELPHCRAVPNRHRIAPGGGVSARFLSLHGRHVS